MSVYQAFVGGTFKSQGATVDSERTVNFYVEEIKAEGATAKFALYPTPGVTQLSEAGIGPGRGHFFLDGREFAVIGTTFYEISSSGALTSRGTVALDDNPATISSNGAGGGQLFITSGGNGYNYDLSTDTLSAIAALSGKATIGGHLDGYFLALDQATSTVYFSNLLDGTTWDALDFFQRSIAPDPWMSMKVLGRYIWLFGSETSEVWYDAGTSPVPFAPHPSGLIQYGTAAAFSPAILGDEIIWLGASREGQANVVRASGFTPEVISNYPLEWAFNGYSVISDAIADSYAEAGHAFYILSFTNQNVTWAWDHETGIWCERGTWVIADNKFSVWRPRYHALAFGQHRMLDSSGGSVYQLSASTSTDVDSLNIRRLRRAPALVNEHERIFYSAFELDLEPGLGLVTGQGSDPQVMMRFSDDGGKTWSSEQMRSAGKLGEYTRRVRWNRLGAGRRRVFEISMSDPIPWRVSNAYLTLGVPIQKQKAS